MPITTWALLSKIKATQKIEAYKKVLSITPDFAEAYYNMGTALKDQGNLEEAVEAYQSNLHQT